MLVFLSILALIVLATFAYGGWRGAPWVPTKPADVARFIKIANLRPGQIVFDLGCGDGRLVAAAAELDAMAQGYEVSLLPYILAKLRLWHLHNPRARVFFRDFWFENLSSADVVYFFLTPEIMSRIKAKFEHELKAGAKVISYVWPIPGWQPKVIDRPSRSLPLYLYEM